MAREWWDAPERAPCATLLSSPLHPLILFAGRRLAPTKAASSTASAKPVAVAKEEVELGKSGLMVSSVGIGAWSWGDRSLYWDAQGAGFGKEGAAEAFQACLELGATFIDTAEARCASHSHAKPLSMQRRSPGVSWPYYVHYAA